MRDLHLKNRTILIPELAMSQDTNFILFLKNSGTSTAAEVFINVGPFVNWFEKLFEFWVEFYYEYFTSHALILQLGLNISLFLLASFKDTTYLLKQYIFFPKSYLVNVVVYDTALIFGIPTTLVNIKMQFK